LSKPTKILFTIPNFDTAGSGIPVLKVVENIDRNLFDAEIACLHDRGELFKDVRKSKAKVHLIDLYRSHRPISRMLNECYQLSKIFKKINPDIIHSYHYAADYTEPLAARMAGIRWIYTKKNMSWDGPSFRAWKVRSLLANGIICQNTDMIKTFFSNTSKATLIPIGVDINSYRSKPVNKEILNKWGIKNNERIIINVANFIPVKGIEILIAGFKALYKKYPNWKLLLVGDDDTEYAKKIKSKISHNLQLSQKIIFTGKQNRIRELLDISELYVQPTLDKGRKEGAPISILEAMANGKVVLGSNIPGIKDQLKEFPGHLFNPNHINELINKLDRFMSNSISQNKQLGKIFYDEVKNKFSLNHELKGLRLFYNKIL